MTDNIILEGVVGSTAYGLATPESDIDMLGIFQAETRDLVSLTPKPDTKVFHEPDKTYHELNKFVALLVKNNPTVMEFLWLDEYTRKTSSGQILVENRQAFLSQQVRATYGGYALQQKERLLRRQDDGKTGFAADLGKRTEKHGRHCCRLLIQGRNILQTGELRVRLTEEEIALCRHAGVLAATDVEQFALLFDFMDDEFKKTESDLPDKPSYEFANNLIWQIRGI